MLFALRVGFDAFVENIDRMIENHLVAQADINAVAMAVGVADTKVNFPRFDLRLADTVTMVVDMLAEGLRASAREEQCSQKRDEPDPARDA